MLIARTIELLLGTLSVALVAWRYSRRTTIINSADLLIWVLIVFYVTPLFVDGVGYVPTFTIYPAFNQNHQSPRVILYTAAVVLAAVAATTAAARRLDSSARRRQSNIATPQSTRVMFLLTLLPLAAVLLSPDPAVYRTFAAAFKLRGVGQPFADSRGALAQFQVFVQWTTFISVVALAVWYNNVKRSRLATLYVVAIVAMDFWLNGKRHVVAVAVLLLLFTAIEGRDLDRASLRRGAIYAALGLTLVLGVSTWYQSTYRPFIAANGDGAENITTDYGRLDVLQLAVDRQLHPDHQRPLNYAGQSFVLDARALLTPILGTRSAAESAVYSDRVDSIARELPIENRGGAITTSIISESIDNFGLLGLVIVYPAVLWGVGLVWRRSEDQFLVLVTSIAGTLLLVTHALAVIPLLLAIVARSFQLAARQVAAGSTRDRRPVRVEYSTGARR